MELRDLKIGVKGFKDWFTKHFPDSKAWVRKLDESYGIVSLVMITSVQHKSLMTTKQLSNIFCNVSEEMLFIHHVN